MLWEAISMRVSEHLFSLVFAWFVFDFKFPFAAPEGLAPRPRSMCGHLADMTLTVTGYAKEINSPKGEKEYYDMLIQINLHILFTKRCV